jgi:sugar O-acyltransferase (sialic acid O-acetyltransferase NeuD family)
LELAALSTDRLITEAMVRELASRQVDTEISFPQFSDSHILIYGAGGHAKAVMDMVRAIGAYQIAGIVDDKIPTGTEVLGIPVLGSRTILPQLARARLKWAANGVGGIIDIGVRVKIFTLLEENGFSFPALVHPRAMVEPSAQVGEGVQVFPQAYVGSSVVLHPRCMVNTGAIVSHDCEIGSYSHIAPGAMLAGHVHVGERTLVGMGVTTAIGIRIGSGARIGNSAILYADVPDRAIIKTGSVYY